MASTASTPHIPLLPFEKITSPRTPSLLDTPSTDSAFFKHSKGLKSPLRRQSPWWEVTVHFCAITTTTIVILPNFKEQYWQDVGHWNVALQNNILKGLQVLSKWHEIILVASLCHLVLHYARRLLVDSKRGVPLALLGPSYAAGSPSILLQWSFWRSCFRRRHLLYALLLLSTSILALFLGPASAAAMIPSLDWFHVAGALPKDNSTVYIVDVAPLTFNSTEIWPLTFKEALLSQFQALSCQPYSQTLELFAFHLHYLSCPLTGYQDLRVWFTNFILKGALEDVVFKDRTSNAQRLAVSKFLPVVTDSGKDAAITITTVIPELLLNTMGAFWYYAQRNGLGKLKDITMPQIRYSNDIALYQPLVHVNCFSDMLSPDIEDVTFPSLAGSLWNDADSNENGPTLDVGARMWQNASLVEPDFRVKYTFEWFKDTSQNASSSLLALAKVPMVARNDQTGDHQSVAIVPCSIDARWAAASVSYQPWNSSTVSSNVTDAVLLNSNELLRHDRPAEHFRQRYGISERPLDLQLRWAKFLNFKTDISNDSTMSDILWLGTSINKEMNFTEFRGPNITTDGIHGAVKENVARLIGVVIADGIARTHRETYVPVLNLDDGNDKTEFFNELQVATKENNTRDYTYHLTKNPSAKLLELRFEVDRYGYGFSLSSVSTKLALTCLLFHAAMILAHLLYILISRIRGTFIHCSPWSDMGELVTLAANSEPSPAISGTSSGISVKETWDVIARIRVGNSRKPELMFSDPEDYKYREAMKLAPGKKY